MRFVWIALVSAAAVLAPWPSPLDAPGPRGQEAAVQLDVKYDPTTYVNRRGPLMLVVSTCLLQNIGRRAYMPVEVGIANAGQSPALLTRAGITLIDQEGRRLAPAGPEELLKASEQLGFDHEKARVPHLVGPVFSGFRAERRRFTPSPEPDALVFDTIDLPANAALVDILYFKMPAEGVGGRIFRLEVQAKGAAEPAAITFKVD